MNLTEKIKRAWRAFNEPPPEPPPRVTYAVITRVPDSDDPEEAKGNLALRTAYHPEAHRPLDFPTYGEVFLLGEILILDALGHREEGGEQRCPAKWDVEFELFGNDVEAAVRRANDVIRESWKGLVAE